MDILVALVSNRLQAQQFHRQLHAYLIENGWVREEVGSGWYIHEKHGDLLFAEAVGQQLEDDGIDVRLNPTVLILQDEPGRSGATGQGL